jgi:acetoin utilization deacetylase AcuC-like enzyme
MKVFYNPQMSTPSHGFSPSGSKPAAAVADWQSRGLDIQIVDFKPVTEQDLCLAHDPTFVKRVLARQEANGHGNRLKEVTDSCLWTCGSMVAASRQALIDGITCSPSSGFHHAGYSYNGCFCTWNALVIAARKLIQEGRVSKVGIIDCDAHYGDGTQDCIEVLELQDTIKHWTFGEEFVPRTFSQKRLIKQLGSTIKNMHDQGVELILYQAGADPHKNDPLGGFMTTAEMRERDELVFDMCANRGIPVAYAHAGGYIAEPDGSIPQVLEIHRNTAMEAIAVLNKRASDVSIV